MPLANGLVGLAGAAGLRFFGVMKKLVAGMVLLPTPRLDGWVIWMLTFKNPLYS